MKKQEFPCANEKCFGKVTVKDTICKSCQARRKQQATFFKYGGGKIKL